MQTTTAENQRRRAEDQRRCQSEAERSEQFEAERSEHDFVLAFASLSSLLRKPLLLHLAGRGV